MGKNEFLTPKAIANRIKAKGLQKLRWYCQMCQKQCRDENGFKCHCMSEGHQRQMQVFGQAPERVVDGYTEEFERTFVEHVRRSHRFSRVAATVLYNEYIADRHHVHMNATNWATLTDFVKHLGRTGVAKVEETPKGWFLTLIDREPETLLREGLARKRERGELAGAERAERELQEQIERAAKEARIDESAAADAEPVGTELQRPADGAGDKVAFALRPEERPAAAATSAAPATSRGTSTSSVRRPSIFEEEEAQATGNGGGAAEVANGGGSRGVMREDGRGNGSTARRADGGSANGGNAGTGGGVAAELMREAEAAKERAGRRDYWLSVGLVVKVMSAALREAGYYKQKGVVTGVVGRYVGEVRIVGSGDVLRVDQAELETVLPPPGGPVRIVNGAHRGHLGRLLGVDTAAFAASVRLERGPYDGKVLPAVDYEDVCKVDSAFIDQKT
eukprot:SM000004S15143  [mRNA]  locus=s4:1514408:1516393:+ [translate_table: standard]